MRKTIEADSGTHVSESTFGQLRKGRTSYLGGRDNWLLKAIVCVFLSLDRFGI